MIQPTNARRKARRRRGTHTVEFALVFPIVMVFFLGLIFLSRALSLKDAAQHAAFEGARAGVLLNSSEVDCHEAVQVYASKLGLKDVRTFVSPQRIINDEEVITVRVEIPMEPNAWVSTGFVPTSLDLSSQVTLTRRSSE